MSFSREKIVRMNECLFSSRGSGVNLAEKSHLLEGQIVRGAARKEGERRNLKSIQGDRAPRGPSFVDIKVGSSSYSAE